MKFFSCEQVARSYKALREATEDKFWGILAILHSINEPIVPNKCYKVSNSKLSNYLEDIFRIDERKEFRSTDFLYVKFSTYWHNAIKDLFLKTTPNVTDLIVWAYRNSKLDDSADYLSLLKRFMTDFNLNESQLKGFSVIGAPIFDWSFSSTPHTDLDLVKQIGLSKDPGLGTIKMDGTFVKANAGELSRGPFIQPLYAGLSTADCLLISQHDFDEYYKSTPLNMPTTSPELKSSPFRPYITAIKSKPFLLLAGISGTGKSRIVRELARACWDPSSKEYKEQKPRNFEMVQVKPNWHDSSELIGYVSRVSGSHFVAGDFLKFVARAWEEPNVPYFLCLDEMNLAPVEQYFAEYLSVVESRKVQKDGKIVTDPILPIVSEQWYYDLVGQLTEDGHVQDRFKNEGISIPQNLIVVGTVNMDETTFSFSRKVLDRAMTIEMNEVDLYGGLTTRHEQIGKLGTAELIGTAVEGVDVYTARQAECDTALGYLGAVNDQLEGTPFKIAYRTRNEFLLYVVNNLPYNKDKDNNELSQDYVIARALDEITSMKILSRIEGDETKVSKDFLKGLSNTIKEQLETVSADYDTDASISLKKLEEMQKRLEGGYTGFWS